MISVTCDSLGLFDDSKEMSMVWTDTTRRRYERKSGRKFMLTKAQVRLAQAAMSNRDTSVADLCNELGVKPVTLCSYVDPDGNLGDYGKRKLAA